jgi:hypothetical protein
MPSPVLNACKRLSVLGPFCLSLSAVWGDVAFTSQGEEYPVAGLLRGEQVYPHLSLGGTGGYLVWQDNATDGDGLGIRARRLNSDLLGSLGAFRVNEQGAGNQENPKVKLLKNGGAVFVWQGGPLGEQDIFARFLAPDGTFATGDVRVNTFTARQQMNPTVAVLPSGSVIVAWSSWGQDGSMQGAFAQALSSAGEKIGTEFQVNQFTAFNQRTPAVASLSNGNFVVAWVSEQNRFENSIDIYARIFGSGREPLQNEFLVNSSTNICANPVVNPLPGGGFMIGWSQRDIGNLAGGWDVEVRPFDSTGKAVGTAVKVNTHVNGNHYAPQIASVGENHLVVWTSSGQDGSQEGIFGRFVASDASMASPEFQVNSYSGGQQNYPTVASDGASQFLASWSSFIGGQTSVDIFAQRFAYAPLIPAPPFVSALSPSRLSVTWPNAGTNAVTGYELYVDDSAQPILATGNMSVLSALAPASKHTVKLAYRFSDGTRSPLSLVATGVTWGSDENFDGLPDDWQSRYWGNNSSKWPDPNADSDGDGASNLREFLAGTDPADPKSVLSTKILSTPQGSFLTWNTQPGFIYQVQSANRLPLEKKDEAQNWADVGSPRFASGADDSMPVERAGNSVYYRVKLVR